MTDASAAYKKLHAQLKRIRAKTLKIMHKAAESSDTKKANDVRNKLNRT